MSESLHISGTLVDGSCRLRHQFPVGVGGGKSRHVCRLLTSSTDYQKTLTGDVTPREVRQ